MKDAVHLTVYCFREIVGGPKGVCTMSECQRACIQPMIAAVAHDHKSWKVMLFLLVVLFILTNGR